MSIVVTQHEATNQLQTHERHESSCGILCSKNTYSTAASRSRCCGSYCNRCTSQVEQAIYARLQHLQAGHNLAQEVLTKLGRRLPCLPLPGSSYRFLKHQFQIVTDYLSANDVRNDSNRWGAIFHLRLIGARIRAARATRTSYGTNCDEARALNSSCCGCSAT